MTIVIAGFALQLSVNPLENAGATYAGVFLVRPSLPPLAPENDVLTFSLPFLLPSFPPSRSASPVSPPASLLASLGTETTKLPSLSVELPWVRLLFLLSLPLPFCDR
jgi:hypothetical protein